MTAPPIIHRARGPEARRDRLRRNAARDFALRFLTALERALEGLPPEFRIEVRRSCIRGLSKGVETDGDASRATGILAGAQADLTPAWEAERSAGRAEAEALFSGEGGQ